MRTLSAVALLAGTIMAGAGLHSAALAQGAGPGGGEGPMVAERGADGERGGERRWRRSEKDHHRGKMHRGERRDGERGGRHGRNDDRDDDRGRRFGRDDDDHRRMGRGRNRGEGGHGRGHRWGGEDSAARMFDRLDADSNGSISREEAMNAPRRDGQGRFAGRISRLDTNDDNSVTPAEIDSWLQRMRAGLLERHDINGDGQIDEADRTARLEQRFARLDADNDGSVTREEARQVMGEFRRHMKAGMRERARGFWRGGAQ